jgi:hypothetical protein
MFEPALATYVDDPLLVASMATAIALFVAIGIVFHRLFRELFILRWIIWSYLVNGIGFALHIFATPGHALEQVWSPHMLYLQGVMGAALVIVIWPLMWLFANIGTSMSPAGPLTMLAVFISPVGGLLIGAAIADNVHRRLRPRSSRPDVGSTVAE